MIKRSFPLILIITTIFIMVGCQSEKANVNVPDDSKLQSAVIEMEQKDTNQQSTSSSDQKANETSASSVVKSNSTQQVTVASGVSKISFGEFFDGGNRTTPSNKFWDLTGKQVEIKGYMGEVISLEKNWFLLIPAPGAECPFDNGNGQLWNEIMIVFVKDGEKLRYTRGPLKVKGTLDVGVKVDQSGYRTMFRLQNATFESI